MNSCKYLALLLSIALFGEVASAQITISGRVTSHETNEPVPGVTVVIDGTFIGTLTDSDGNYSIDLRTEDDVLVFSFVGFYTQRHTISQGAATLDVQLEPSVVKLEEISVVAEEPRIFASNVVGRTYDASTAHNC